ncbi:MAG TPA: hypothetical protein VFJ82_10625 [Longimicrobium sp.]|nr:hypothetical protein [Longimicrobium sp.]
MLTVREQMEGRGASAADLERYRIALKDAIAFASLRAVAGAVGMSPTGLTKFLDGSNPYGRTLERVRTWYYNRAGVHQTPPEEIIFLLRRFVVTLPEPNTGVVYLLAAVDAAYRHAGMYVPDWVSAVRARLAR